MNKELKLDNDDNA